MKFVSLDIETTSSDPWSCAPLMVSMVVADTDDDTPVGKLPHKTLVVNPWASDVEDEFTVAPMAMAMNAWLLATIESSRGVPVQKIIELCGESTATRVSSFPVISLNDLDDELSAFLLLHFPKGRITVAGKNVGAFDAQIVKRWCPSTHAMLKYSHLDVGSMAYESKLDSSVPSLKTIAERLSIKYDAHDAYGDAKAVIEVIRKLTK